MAMPKQSDRTITVRLDPDALSDFRALREWLEGRIPVGVRMTATTVIRAALALSLEAIGDSKNGEAENRAGLRLPADAVGVQFPPAGGNRPRPES